MFKLFLNGKLNLAFIFLLLIFMEARTALSQNSISGSITNGSGPISGITLRLRQGGTEITTVNSASDGTFIFPGLANGTYSVVPDSIANGYRFSPDSLTAVINSADITSINFTAIRQYTISGTINSGSALSGITIALSGHSSSTLAKNSGDSYSFRIDSGYQYTVTPAKTGFTFNPANRSFDFTATHLSSDQSNQNFDVVLYSISGTLKNGANGPISNITINLKQNNIIKSTTTSGSDGTYTFSNLLNGTYTIVPDSITNGYRFSPDTLAAVINNGDISNKDFTGIKQYTISGTVTPAGINAIKIYLSGHKTDSTTINSGLQYSFRIDSGYSYTITPSKSGGYTFTPANKSFNFTVLSADQSNQDFIANVYSISGTIKNPANNPIGNITVKLRQNGASIANTTSSNDGTFTFINLPNGNYSLAPDSITNGYRFTPDTSAAVISGANITNKDFTGIKQYTISGTVTPVGISSIKIYLSGQKTDSTTINSSFQYSFRVDSGYSYTVTPSKSGGYTFTPANKSFNFTALNTDQSNQDFVAVVYSISGTIKNPGNTAISNITIRLRQNGTSIANTTSASDGTYTFINLPNGSYSLAPDSLTNGYRFTPDTSAAVINNANITNKDFTGIKQYTISGTVTPNGISSIRIGLSGQKTDSVFINSGSQYSFRVDSGYSYTVTPSKSGGYTFTPANKSFNFATLNTDQANQDFAAVVYSISGTIKNQGNSALRNITIRLRQNGTSISSTTSANDGTYTFANLINGTYSLAPDSITNGYRFTPDTSAAVINNANITNKDFTGIKQYTISGTVTPTGISSIKMSLSGQKTDSVIINSGSQYSFRVDSGYSYTITPSKLGGYTFTPANKSFNFTLLNADQSNQDFAAVVYSISGTLKNPGNSALRNITIRLRQNGSSITSTTSANDGTYTFANLVNGTYSVAPDSITNGYRFTPDTSAAVINNANITNKDFTGIKQYTISGTVTPNGISSIRIGLSGQKTDSVFISSGSQYSFRVDSGYSYTVTPSKSGGYTFTPSNKSFNFTLLNADQLNQDFAAVVYSISGTIKNPGNNPLSNITIRLRQNGASIASTISTNDGTYSFTNLPNATYTIAPDSITNGYRFTPDSSNAVVNNSNVTGKDFTGIRQYTLSGTVTTIGIINITITLGGGHQSGTQTINSNVQYSFRVDSGYTYTITPSKTSYVFTPASYSYTNLSSDQSNQNFTTNQTGFNISGVIANAGSSPIYNITVKLRQSGSLVASVVTDGTGNYIFNGVPNGTYTIAPDSISNGYRFTPDTLVLTVNNADQTNKNFTALRVYTISGVTSTAGFTNITLTLSGHSAATQTVNSNVTYSFRVDSGFSYTVTPSLTGYTFTPANQSYNFSVLSTNQTNQNYTINVWSISGTIRNGASSPVSNITVRLRQNGATLTSTTSASDGSYTFSNRIAGSYSILPDTLSGYRFIPDSLAVTIAAANLTGNDFTAIKQYTITGTVTTGGLTGILISLAGNTSMTQTINSNQAYTLKADSGFNYTVTPSKAGYIFTPGSYTYNNINANYATQNFTAASGAPTIRTDAISNPTSTSVRLNGFIQPNLNGRVVTLSFEWGTTTAYGNTVVPTPASYTATSGTSNTTFLYNLSGLTAGVVYHYRAKGTYTGGTIYGADMTFTPYTSTNLFITGRTDIAVINPNPVQDGMVVNLNYILNNGSAFIPNAQIDYYISTDKVTLYKINANAEYRDLATGANNFAYTSGAWPPASNPPNNNNTNSDGYYVGANINGVLYWLQSDQRLVYAGCIGVTASNVTWTGNDFQITLTLKNYDAGHKITIKNIIYSIISSEHNLTTLMDTIVADGTQLSKAGLAGDVYTPPTITWRNLSSRLPPGTYYIKWNLDRTGCGAAGPVSDFFLWDISPSSSGFTINNSGISLAINNSQIGPIDTALTKYFVLKLTTGTGTPVAGIPFTFMITQNIDGNASISKTNGITNASGQDSTLLTLGHALGNYVVSVNVPAGYLPALQTFTGTAMAGNLNKISGDGQSGMINTALAAPFVVTVTNYSGKLMQGAPITFQITQTPGGGSLSATSAVTDANGQAQVYLTLGPSLGTYEVTASTTYPVLISSRIFTVTANNLTDLFASATSVTPAPSTPYNISTAPDVILSGDPISINNFYTQTTLSTASAFEVNFYLGLINPSSHVDSFKYYMGKQSFPAGISLPGILGTYQYTVPLSVPNGTYYVYYWIDTVNGVLESTKLNNRGRIASTLSVQSSLFWLGAAVLQFSSPAPGNIFDIQIKLDNIALKDTSSFEVGLVYDSSVIKFSESQLAQSINEQYNNYVKVNLIKQGDLFISGKLIKKQPAGIYTSFLSMKFIAVGKEGDSSKICFSHFTVDNMALLVTNNVVYIKGATGISFPKELPLDFTLTQNYPNPFNPSTVIMFGLPSESNITLKIYNLLGKEVYTLYDGVAKGGWHNINFNAKNLASGIYYYQLKTKEMMITRKMILMK